MWNPHESTLVTIINVKQYANPVLGVKNFPLWIIDANKGWH